MATTQTKLAVLACALIACSPPVSGTGTDGGSSGSSDASRRIDAGESSFDKYALWTNGQLRGANIYQQDEGRDDGESGSGFGPVLALSDLTALRQAGANLVVFSVPGTYHVRSIARWPAMAAHLRQLIDWAEQADLFAVIAFRTGPGRGKGDITEDGLDDRSVYTDETQRQGWVEMWRETAAEFSERPHVVGYDIQVEPHDHSPSQWSTLAQRIINGIREVDERTPILVSPGDWGGYDALENFVPLADREARLVYSVHQYEPYEFTHEDMQLSAEAIDLALADIYGAIEQWETVHQRTVAITEFGYDIGKSKATSLQFLSTQLDEMESRNLGHAIWLWEVSAADYHDFDVRFYPDVLEQIAARWQQNTSYP